KRLKKEGKTIILITHKLNEVMAVSDRVTVMRKGKVIGTRTTSNTTPQELAEMMVGRKIVLKVEKDEKEKGKEIIRIEHLMVRNPKKNIDIVKDVSFYIKQGEIVGIAGVAGNGQTELVEAISGLRKIDSGHVYLNNREITDKTPYEIRMEGLAHIPEDRKGMGLIMEFTVGENIVIGRHTRLPFAKGIVMQKKVIRERAKNLGEKFDIRPNSPNLKVKFLSGGNQQKVIIAREFDYDPVFLLASQPTRGLDVGAIEYVYKYLLKARDENKGVLLISMELEEVLSLSDRILVMYNGEIVGEFNEPEKFDIQLIGRLMLQGREGIN
ncbi:MAG TPA: ATP-binding cassette domain-containing protein, partial [Candidatus Atribacteria bacterium]|nr:ATP-binding cassette domain-containing protein [Candidatus Atribacteria bacterium]